jgi:hypothetical protein
MVMVAGIVALWLVVPIVEPDSSGAVVAVGLLAIAMPLGLLIADSLRQETTTNYPLPRGRAALYGTSFGAIVAGLVLLTWFVTTMAAAWVPFAGLTLVVGGVLGAIYAGVTQTNRKKAWVRSARAGFEAGDAFTNNPNAAARFGIYSGALWFFAIAAFIGIALSVGFGWAWAVFVVAVIVQMIMLARMLFRESTPRD